MFFQRVNAGSCRPGESQNHRLVPLAVAEHGQGPAVRGLAMQFHEVDLLGEARHRCVKDVVVIESLLGTWIARDDRLERGDQARPFLQVGRSEVPVVEHLNSAGGVAQVEKPVSDEHAVRAGGRGDRGGHPDPTREQTAPRRRSLRP